MLTAATCRAVLDVREAVRSLWALPESSQAVQSLYRFLTKSMAALLQVSLRDYIARPVSTHALSCRPCGVSMQ